jgi:hypothetical protein
MLKTNIKTPIEQCYKLRLSDLPKGLLHPEKDFSGKFTKYNGINKIEIKFNRVYERDIKLYLHVKGNNYGFDQEVEIDFDYVNFGGSRPYLLCQCGYRANVLYMKPGNYIFACRECHHLTYNLRHINRAVYGSELLYRHHHHMKIEEKKERIKRITYAGKYTRHTKSLIRMIAKWKIDEAAERLISKNIKKFSTD